MNEQTKGAIMLDRSQTEAVLARVAVAAFTYYPKKSVEEPGYAVDEDVDWAMEPMRTMDATDVASWRQRVTDVITDSNADRRAFIADLMALAEG